MTVKLPPMPKNLFSNFWTHIARWELSAEGDEAGAAGDQIEAVVKERMRAYAIQAVLEERDRCAAMFDKVDGFAAFAAAIRAQPEPVRDAADLLAYTPAHASAVSSGRRGFGGVW